MSTRLTVVLSNDEADALTAIARNELREPRDQLRLLMREELSRRGVLVSTVPDPGPDRRNAKVRKLSEDLGGTHNWGAEPRIRFDRLCTT